MSAARLALMPSSLIIEGELRLPELAENACVGEARRTRAAAVARKRTDTLLPEDVPLMGGLGERRRLWRDRDAIGDSATADSWRYPIPGEAEMPANSCEDFEGKDGNGTGGGCSEGNLGAAGVLSSLGLVDAENE